MWAADIVRVELGGRHGGAGGGCLESCFTGRLRCGRRERERLARETSIIIQSPQYGVLMNI